VTGNEDIYAYFIADYDSNRLFWVDAKLHVIFTSDFDGRHRQVVLTSYSNLGHPFSVAVFEACSSFSATAVLLILQVFV